MAWETTSAFAFGREYMLATDTVTTAFAEGAVEPSAMRKATSRHNICFEYRGEKL
jgi:hypothetical protein